MHDHLGSITCITIRLKKNPELWFTILSIHKGRGRRDEDVAAALLSFSYSIYFSSKKKKIPNNTWGLTDVHLEQDSRTWWVSIIVRLVNESQTPCPSVSPTLSAAFCWLIKACLGFLPTQVALFYQIHISSKSQLVFFPKGSPESSKRPFLTILAILAS